MTNYENDIMNLLRGDTPKQKYENLKTLIDIAHDGIGKDKVMEIAEFSMGVGYGMQSTEKVIGEIETKDKVLKLKEILKKEYDI